MLYFEYKELLENFEYDEQRGCWIRLEDKKAFYLYQKGKDDLIEAKEVENEGMLAS
jgi:hypothetical protein